MIRRNFLIALIGVSLAGLTACENARKDLGLEKNPPDEFAVVKRAPLEMPPNYALRPPKPGAPRPQEQSPEAAAKEAVFGEVKPAAKSSQIDGFTAGESALLNKTGAATGNSDIRALIDSETQEINAESKPTIDRLLSVTGKKYDAPAKVVDAPAEMERLKKNKEAGKPVTEGETPTVEN